MKAKEYISKYKPRFDACTSVEELTDKSCDLFKELAYEANDLVQRRGAKRGSAIFAILKEQDVKWQIIVKAFPDIYKPSGWKDYWIANMPVLRDIW